MYDKERKDGGAQNIDFIVPHWPATCNHPLCLKPTNVAFLVVEKNSKTQKGAFSQFGYVDKQYNWRLNRKIEFKGWITWCGEHYQQ